MYMLPVFEHCTVQFLGHVQVNIDTFVLVKCGSIPVFSILVANGRVFMVFNLTCSLAN